MEELHKTWDDIASNWHRWGPPLRPQKEDLELMQAAMVKWDKANNQSLVDVFILGVTPELATMEYPFHAPYIMGMDIAPNMVKEIWPGDIPGYRRAMVGDWFNCGIIGGTDIALADGSFVFFNHEKTSELTSKVASLLPPKGMLIIRQFVSQPEKQSLAEINELLSFKDIRSFHELKFRVAMALQNSSDEGVEQGLIYEAVKSLGNVIYNPFFSQSDLLTLEFYKGKTAKMHFPTIQEYREIFTKHFSSISVEYPSYDFGYACPTIVLQKPIK